MKKKVIVAVLAASMLMTACSSTNETTEDGNITTAQSDISSELVESDETASENDTTETSETSVETTVTETTSTLDVTIDDFLNAITSDYFNFGASLDTNDDIINSRGALGVNGYINIYEFNSTEGLNVGDQITIISTPPGEDSKELKYTIAAINGQFVLVANEWGTVAENDHAPYAIPEVQSAYEAFLAYQG